MIAFHLDCLVPLPIDEDCHPTMCLLSHVQAILPVLRIGLPLAHVRRDGDPAIWDLAAPPIPNTPIQYVGQSRSRRQQDQAEGKTDYLHPSFSFPTSEAISRSRHQHQPPVGPANQIL